MRRHVFVLAVLAAGIACGWCAAEEAAESAGLRGGNEVLGQAEMEEWVHEKLRSMSLTERVAQLMLVTMQGAPRADVTDVSILKYCLPGGVVIPKILRPETAAEYIDDVRRNPAVAESQLPLFIGTNLYHLPLSGPKQNEFFSQLPSMLAIAAADNPDATTRLARLLAEHLRIMGFNMHIGPSLCLAPSLDGAKGTIDCFGSSPAFVSESGAAFIRAFQEEGVMSMPMGFPGGGTNRSHGGPALLLTPKDQLKEAELLPYVNAISAGITLLNVGTTLAPALTQPGVPACLAPEVLRDLLREELGYQGLIVAGPMDHPDISRKYDPRDAAVMALRAGADMLYWQEPGQRVMRVVEHILDAVTAGELSQDVIDRAASRVIAMKFKCGLHSAPAPDARAAEELSIRSKYPAESFRIERESVTVLLNRDSTLPLTRTKSNPVYVTGVVGVHELRDALEEHLRHVAQQEMATAKHGGRVYDFEIRRITSAAEGARVVVMVLTSGMKAAGPLQLLGELRAQGARVVVVLLGYPEGAPLLIDADAIVAVYCKPSACAQSMRAVADALTGHGTLRVVPPTQDLEARAGESREYNALHFVRSPSARLPVTLDGPFVAGLSAPCNPEEAIKRVRWDFGDGTRKKKKKVEKKYKEPGRYPITLKVRDRRGFEFEETFHVNVR